MEIEADNGVFEILAPVWMKTGVDGTLNSKSLKVVNNSDRSLIVFSKGDNFSLEDTKVEVEVSADISGGFGVGCEVEKAQRNKESIVPKEVVPKNGTSTVQFHGAQNFNYISLGFVDGNVYRLILENKQLAAGTVITVKEYPEDESMFIKDITLDTGGGQRLEHIEYMIHFAEEVKLPLNAARKDAAAKFYMDHGEPRSMEDVVAHDHWNALLAALKVPKEKSRKVELWKHKFDGCRGFLIAVRDPDPEVRLAKAHDFLKARGFHALQEVVDEGQECQREFVEALALNRRQRDLAVRFFRKMRPTEEKHDSSRPHAECSGPAASPPTTPAVATTTLRVPSSTFIAEAAPKEVEPVERFEFDDDCGETFRFESPGAGEGLVVCNVVEEAVKLTVTSVAAVREEGGLTRFVAVLQNKEITLVARCDTCDKQLPLGPEWYHQGHRNDRCKHCRDVLRKKHKEERRDRKGSSDIKGSSDKKGFLRWRRPAPKCDTEPLPQKPKRKELWSNFKSIQVLQKYMRKHFDEEALEELISYYAVDVPPVVTFDNTDDWDDDVEQNFKAFVEKAGAAWEHFDDSEELEEFMQKLFSDVSDSEHASDSE